MKLVFGVMCQFNLPSAVVCSEKCGICAKVRACVRA